VIKRKFEELVARVCDKLVFYRVRGEGYVEEVR